MSYRCVQEVLMANSVNLTPQTKQQVRERAYEIYLAREGQEGD
jgi:hypothetical protein